MSRSTSLPPDPNTMDQYMTDEDLDMSESNEDLVKIIMVHCRLCTTIIHKQDAICIYGNEKNIADKISQCLPILIIPQDNFSKYVCETCSDQLELCADLTLKSIEAEKFFKRQLEDALQRQDIAENAKTIKDENLKKSLNPDGPVICDLCGHKKFSNMDTFDTHMVTIHDAPQLGLPELVFTEEGKPKYECRACHKQWDSESDLRDHESTHKELTCKSCGQFHSTAQALQRHTCPKAMIVTPLLPSTCNVCEANFDKYAQLKIHMKEAHGDELLEEYPEEEIVDDVQTLQEIQDGVDTMVSEDKTDRLKFQCQKCGRRFINAGNLARHVVTHMEQIACDVCQKKFTAYSAMIKHRRQHGGGFSTDNCHICSKVFYKHSELIKHLHSEHNVPRNECSPWCCRFCNKRMMTKLSLGIHERIHTGQRPFTCDWCGVSFRSKANLLQHHPVHTGQRKYSCNVCGKAFSRKSFVTTHMRVHTGDRPYACDLCGAKFTQVGDMRRHKKKHEERMNEIASTKYKIGKGREKQILLPDFTEDPLYQPGDVSQEGPNAVSIIEIHIPGDPSDPSFRILGSEDEILDS